MKITINSIRKETDDRTFRQRVLEIIAYLIARSFSPQYWFNAALIVTKLTSHFSRMFIDSASIPVNIARLRNIDAVLSMLTRTGIEFPIKSILIANEIPIKGLTKTVLCTAHFPLSRITVRKMIESGINISGALDGDPFVGKYLGIWGSHAEIPIIKESPHTLLEIKTILNNGGNVVLMIDKDFTKISPNVLILARKIYAQILFFITDLEKDNTVCGELLTPPFIKPKSDEEIDENISFFNNYIREYLKKNNYNIKED